MGEKIRKEQTSHSISLILKSLSSYNDDSFQLISDFNLFYHKICNNYGGWRSEYVDKEIANFSPSLRKSRLRRNFPDRSERH